MSERYVIIDGSVSKHCRFSCTIVDTKKIDWEFEGKVYYANACECMDDDYADKICAALNLLDDGK